MARVLVTGSSGAVGRSVCAELLRRGHFVRGLDLVPSPDLTESCVGDITVPDVVNTAMADCDTLVHLAAHPDEADFPDVLLRPNVLGLYHVLHAAREAKVRRVVLASSIQVVGYGRDQATLPIGVETCDPINHYALTKAWAETMGRMYAHKFGLSVLAVRIGWMVRNPAEAAHMAKWQRYELYLSRADAGRFFACAVEAEGIGFEIVYAVSVEGARRFDMEPARRVLGFEAQDCWPSGLGCEVPALEG